VGNIIYIIYLLETQYFVGATLVSKTNQIIYKNPLHIKHFLKIIVFYKH